jgi:hypothetical protein
VARSFVVKDRPLTYKSPTISFPANEERRRVHLHNSEAFVWLSVTKRDPKSSNLIGPTEAFPALLDTGCTESLFIHEWHLANWIGMSLSAFDPTGRPSEVHYQHCPRVKLDLWLHAYEGKSTKEPPTDFRKAAKMQLPDGALVSVLRYTKMFRVERSTPTRRWWNPVDWFRPQQPATSDVANKEVDDWARSARSRPMDSIPLDVYPRLPLIGTKLLRANNILLTLDGRSGSFSLSK